MVMEELALTLCVDVVAYDGSKFFWETAIHGVAELATIGLSVSM